MAITGNVSGDNTELLLKIARLSFQKGDCVDARDHALQAHAQSPFLTAPRNWIESQKILMATGIELRDREHLLQINQELHDALRISPPEFVASLYYLLARWQAFESNYARARDYVEKGIAQAIEFRNMESLAYCLFGLARIEVACDHAVKAMQELEKLATILASHPRPDIEISIYLLKIQIYKQQKNWARALDFAWQAYEYTKLAGYFLYIPIILIEVSILYQEQKSLEEARIYLALAEKGTSEKNQPLLYSFIQAQKNQLGISPNAGSYDLIIDEDLRTIKERTKGVIDFKNQHTLLEMALLFVKNPHATYTKEQLFESVWHQTYDPATHDNLIYVTVKRLRSLLEPDHDNPRYILRNRAGYYFNNSNSLFIQTESKNL